SPRAQRGRGRRVPVSARVTPSRPATRSTLSSSRRRCRSRPGRSRSRGCSRACAGMSAERAADLDSSAVVKLAVAEPESSDAAPLPAPPAAARRACAREGGGGAGVAAAGRAGGAARPGGPGTARASGCGCLRRSRLSRALATTERRPMARKLTAEERATLKETLQDAEGEAVVLAKIAELPDADRELAQRVHAIVMQAAPGLRPRTRYGMPAYAKDGKVVCFFQAAAKFKARYATFGFSDKASLDEGHMWPTSFALA